ncbi:hypothetical protein BAJUN_01220 [Bajunvirus bajun]|uniref:Uncharacterized protein n=1 Tax=Brevundimonas phage vB_BgoS-Bajun TaxID=2948594 RepID=A0A9E7SUT4_9CAUD|nr:hypothetical protein BAJUN_01220 [Brevundimonas phage vB_BgoS-Bajun]
MSGAWKINKTVRSLLDDEVVFHVEHLSDGVGQSWRVRAPRAKGVTKVEGGIDEAATEAMDQRDAFDRAILFGRGWSAEKTSLFDEEGVDGWQWSHPEVMQDYGFIGDWEQPAPVEMSLIEAEEERLKKADAPKPPRAPLSKSIPYLDPELIDTAPGRRLLACRMMGTYAALLDNVEGDERDRTELKNLAVLLLRMTLRLNDDATLSTSSLNPF